MILKKGFTLIELLVVIAIIGVITSIVLVSLNTARSRANNTSIKSNLSNIRAQAEIYYETPGNYGTVSFGPALCSGDVTNTLFVNPRMRELIEAAGNVSNGGGIGSGTCASTPTSWAVSVPLFSDQTQSWCVDSQGASKQRTGAITTTNC